MPMTPRLLAAAVVAGAALAAAPTPPWAQLAQN